MNIKSILFIAACITSLGLWSCHAGSEHAHEVDEHGHHHHQDHDAESGEHKDVIEIEPEDAEFFGIECDTIYEAPFSTVIHVAGQIEASSSDVYTIASKSAGIISFNSRLSLGSHVGKGEILANVSARNVSGGDSNESAYQAMLAAKRELERVRPLHAEGIVSTREYNAIEAEYNQAQAAYAGSNSGSQIVSNIAGVVTSLYVTDGEYVEVGTPIATVTDAQNLLIRADVPSRKIAQLGNGNRGTLRLCDSNVTYSLDELEAVRLTNKPVAMTGAYVPVYFKIKNNSNIIAGLSAELYLEGNDSKTAIAVPKQAITEQQGINFVYIRLDEDCYKKIPVKIGMSDGNKVEITEGITPGMCVVTGGTTFVKLAESKGSVPEGHTHNH